MGCKKMLPVNFFKWPSNTAFGKALKYLYKQYADNVQINFGTHCETWLKKFFKMCMYDSNDYIFRQNIPNAILFNGNDIKNAMNYAYDR